MLFNTLRVTVNLFVDDAPDGSIDMRGVLIG